MLQPVSVALCVALILASAGPVAAQTSPTASQSPRFNTEIVVTPERGETAREDVPAATVVLSAAELAKLPVTQPSEIMSFVPGFQIVRPEVHAGHPIVSARGFFGGGEAEYVRLFVDGVPVADAESGLIDWSAVPASSIRRVEASRGPGASLYGDAAIGGVVQIFTDGVGTQGQFTTTGGSFETLTGDGALSHQFRRVSLSLSGAGRRTDGGYEHFSSEQMLLGGSADGAVRGMSWRWSATGGARGSDDPGVLSRDVLASTPYASDPIFRFDTVDRHTFSTAFVLRHAGSAWRPQARVYTALRDEDLVRTIPLVPGVADTRARALSSSTIGGSVEAERHAPLARPVVVRFGVDLAREQIDTTYRTVTPDGALGAISTTAAGHRMRAGLFASTAWDAASRVRFTGGVRWDDVDDAGFGTPASSALQPHRAWSPRAGIVTRLTERGRVNLFGQVSRAFKAPTLDQLFDPRPYPDFQGGTFTISNPLLVPQRATNVEAGLSGAGRFDWSVLAYRMHVDDEIDFDARTFTYANIGESRHTGVEVEASGRSWRYIQPQVTYALSRVTDVSSGDGRQLKNVPRHAFTLGSNVGLPWHVGFFARYRRTWGAFIDEENQIPIDGASVVDMRVQRAIGKHSIFVDVMNLTADRYEEYGFTLTSFRGAVVPYAYSGAPRAARVGATVAF
jgi:outer membrane cobalamin receptor